MENNYTDQFTNELTPLPEKPQFLKILCILSFIACGLLIILYGIGSFAMAISEETINGVWDQVVASQPTLENVDPIQFFDQVGKLCLYSLLANSVSLIGVIMMWRLNKIGFFIYVVAELTTNFLGLDLNVDGADKSYISMIFSVVIDLAFITMYAVNLKHMNKTNNALS